MLRQIVTGVLILFLTFWCGLVLAVLPALWQDGLNGIKDSLIHIAGGNGLFGDSSGRLAIVRLSMIVSLSIGTFYLRQVLRRRNNRKEREPQPPNSNSGKKADYPI